MQFVAPTPFKEALQKLGDKSVVTSTLTSSEWSDVPIALRERAFFSSTIESARFLQTARDFLNDFLANNRETLDSGVEALAAGSRAQFVNDMSDLAQRLGIGPLDPEDVGTIKDITSESRLSLIFNTQTRQADDFGYWKQGMDPDLLDEFPAQRFVRIHEVKEPRNSHQPFEDQVALKSNLAFWMNINQDFGVPWGPWGWGCGHDVEDVDRKETEALGLIQPGEKVRPVEKDFNDRLEASATGLDPDLLDKLKGAFGDQVAIEGDRIRWTGKLPAPTAPVAPTPMPAPSPTGLTPDSATSLDSVLQQLGLDTKTVVDASDMTSLTSELQENNPVTEADKIESLKGSKHHGSLTETKVRQYVQEFLNFIPPSIVKDLPDLKLEITRLSNANGEYGRNGIVRLNSDNLGGKPADEVRRVVYHELMHWVHMEGPENYRAIIAKHFADRTAGEPKISLPGYGSSTRGKLDKWYEAYAGRIYGFETKAGGLEVPTRYIEWFTRDPEKLAFMWNNDPYFKETFLVVLKGLFA